MTTTALLKMRGLCMRYDLGAELPPLSVLEDVDLVVASGEATAVTGPSGSGKSTLLHLAAGLARPTVGSVVIGGKDLTELDADARAKLRNHRIGMIFQDHHLLPQCTVLENALVPTLAGWGRGADAEARARALELCERVGLQDRLAHRPAELSGGERQRVAVVRALINEPDLLLADEPTGSLDARNSEQLGDLLCELQRERGLALLVVTHALELAERMGRVLRLTDGRLEEARRTT